MSEDVVLIEDLPVSGGRVLKRVVLNAPKSLNSLSLEMIGLLQPKLEAWDADDRVVCIFLEGAGEKAFCAGGDIVQIYRFMTAGDDCSRADDYFINEYCFDYTLHTLQTPLITWMDGIVMGGGIGMGVAGSHRVVTEKSRLAMPEITIGLYPDVGSTWFLGRMPGRTGLFLGLTGAHMNAADGLFTGLADHFLPAASRGDVLDGLATASDWSRPQQTVGAALREVAARHSAQPPESNVRKHFDLINALVDSDNLVDIVAAIGELADDEDKWLAKAAGALVAGCPVTAHLVYQQYLRGRYLSLAEAFQLELAMTGQCARNPDFREGVRALLIDKDGQPQWTYEKVADVPESYIEKHFTPTWHGEHPMQACLDRRRPALFANVDD